jgi:hypothetical protein
MLVFLTMTQRTNMKGRGRTFSLISTNAWRHAGKMKIVYGNLSNQRSAIISHPSLATIGELCGTP